MSPAIFELRDGAIASVTGKQRASKVELPEFAKPKIARRKKIRVPRRERAVAVARVISKWTWNSVAIALCLHIVALSAAMFFESDIREIVRHINHVEINERTAIAPTPVPTPEPLVAPDVDQLDDETIVPDEILNEQELKIGDPEYKAPPEEVPFAPRDQSAEIQPDRPQPDSVIRPKAGFGLSGGRPDGGISRPKGSGLFKNREGQAKKAAIRKHGGGEDTEQAVNLALAYLARNQDHDGSWDPNDGFDQRPKWATSDNSYRGAITALCTLPFLAAGHSPDQGEYKKEVRRAVNWLIDNQTSDGCVSYRGMQQMYTHTVATLALCEAFGLTDDKEIETAAERAVRFLERSQGHGGGWDYTATASGTERNDLSISGWGVLAVKSARAVGINVNQKTMDRLAELYDEHSLTNGETYYADRSYGALDPHRKGVGMVGVGLTSRVILGRRKFEKRNYAAEKLLVADLPTWEKFRLPSRGASNPNFNTFYSVYYCTLGLFLLDNGQGPSWEKWNTALKSMLLENQTMKGRRKGSWAAVDSWIGPTMGDFYSTALGALSLEVYYRYNPMHRPTVDNPGRTTRAPRDRPARDDDGEDPHYIVIDGETLDLAQPGDRSRYLRLLAKQEGDRATATLIQHLKDESLSVRSTALYELAKLSAQEASGKVQAMLRDPENEPIKLTVVYALGELGDRSVYKSLTPLLGSSDSALKNASESALVSLSDGKDFGINRRAWENWFRDNQ